MAIRLKKTFWILLGALFLLGAAFYNGFPLVTSDSGTYIDSGFKGWLPLDRPIMYGLFTRHSSLASSLWFTIIVQSIILSFLIWKILDRYCFAAVTRQGKLLILTLLVFFSSVSWYSSQIMPDIFTPIGVLCLVLILLVEISTAEWIIVSTIFILSCMVHNSNLIIFSLLIVLIVLSTMFIQEFKRRIRLIKYVVVVSLLIVSGILSATINFGINGKFSLSGSPHAFLLAKNIENGIIDRYLSTNCSDYILNDLPDSSRCFIFAKHSQKLIDINNYSKEEGEKAHQWSYTGEENQQFDLIKVSKRFYSIKSVNSNKCLEVLHDSASGESKVIQKKFLGKDNQLFSFKKAANSDYWYIVNKKSSKNLDVFGYSQDNGGKICDWVNTGGDNQQFKLVKVPYCLCLYKDNLPNSAVAFLWEENGVFAKTGAWGPAAKKEYNKILKEIYLSPGYLGANIGEAIIATFSQLLRIDIGDGLGGYDQKSSPYQAIKKNLQFELKPFSNSKQNLWHLDFSEVNKRHFWLLFGSLIIIISFIVIKPLAANLNYEFKLFIFICLISVICNAFVTGAMANVLDRLQSRIVWLIPLISIIMIFNYLIPKIQKRFIAKE
jgi:hypothetical protein